MTPSCLDKQTAGKESLHDWLEILGMDLAIFCYEFMPFGHAVWIILKRPGLMPFGHNFFESELPTTLWLPTNPPIHPPAHCCSLPL